MVRDLLLGKEPVDIDLVIEDDIKSIADSLNRKLKGECLIYPEFGTATIRVGTEQIDLARARTETYPLPAHLPVVRFSDLDKDFSRRDFTVNAVALSLSRKDFGRIIDPVSGIRDIREKSIRVLHGRSFIDDPTRIFRALRYKNRLGFQIEPHTERLLRAAVRRKMIGRLTGQRVLNEYRLIFSEADSHKTLDDLTRLHIARFPKNEYPILSALDDLGLYYFLGKAGLTGYPLKRSEKLMVKELMMIPALIQKLARASRDSELYSILTPVAPAIVDRLTAFKPVLRNKIMRYRKMVKVKPFVTGRDLKRLGLPPGPRYKKLLARVFRRQLDGLIRNKRAALALIVNE